MKVALCGLGKAGIQVLRAVYHTPETELVVAFCRDGSPKAGQRMSDVLPVKLFDAPIVEVRDAQTALRQYAPDVLIDFSDKDATLRLAPVCAVAGVGMVICTTGFTDEEMEHLKGITQQNDAAVVYAPNVTIGINVSMQMAVQMAKMLPDFDYVITERHHNQKKDSISATAQVISGLLDMQLGKETPIIAMRAGGYVGYHEISAVGQYERVTIIHESFSRQAFAQGALMAADYLKGKRGWHVMSDLVSEYLKEKQA